MPAVAQIAGALFVRPEFDLYFPFTTYSAPLTGETKPLYSQMAFGGGFTLDWAVLSWLHPIAPAQPTSTSPTPAAPRWAQARATSA
jgi:hypothetical protein